MEKLLTVKSSARYGKNAREFFDIFDKEGGINSNVLLSEEVGRVKATIDGKDIGLTKDILPLEIPNIYTAKVVKIDRDERTFTVMMSASDGADVFEEADDDEDLYKDEVAYAVENGCMTEKEVRETVKVMTDNRVHPSVIKEALKAVRKYERPVHSPSAIFTDTTSKDKESILNKVLVDVLTRSAVIFAGEKSTGKNICAETIAYVLERPFYRLNFEKDMLLEDIFGTTTTDNSAADALEVELAKSKIICELAPDRATPAMIEDAANFELLKAKSSCIRLVHSTSDIIDWAKNGGVLLFDELNMANANTLQACMNSTADSEKVLIVPGVGEIKLNPDCVLLGGMNPGYAGTFELNSATKSRCGIINFEFPKDIKDCLKVNFSKGSIPDKYYKACNDLYKDFREAVSTGRISSECLNIRGFVNALKAIEKFPEATTLTTQIDVFVIAGCNEDERTLLYTMLNDKVTL